MPGIDAQTREGAAGANGSECILEGGLRAERLDGHVHAATRELFDLGHDVLLFVVQNHVCAHALGHLEPGRQLVDADHERGAAHLRTRGGTQSDRSLRKDRNGIAEAHASALGSGQARGHDVRTQHDILILQPIGDLRQVRLRIRHQHVLRLTAIDGVTEAPTADGFVAVTHVTTLGGRARQTGTALPTRGDGTDDDALALFIADHAGSYFLHHADRLVSHDQPAFYWILTAQDMHVGAADGGQRHSDQRLAHARLRPFNLAQLDGTLLFENSCSHLRHGSSPLLLESNARAAVNVQRFRGLYHAARKWCVRIWLSAQKLEAWILKEKMYEQIPSSSRSASRRLA